MHFGDTAISFHNHALGIKLAGEKKYFGCTHKVILEFLATSAVHNLSKLQEEKQNISKF